MLFSVFLMIETYIHFWKFYFSFFSYRLILFWLLVVVIKILLLERFLNSISYIITQKLPITFFLEFTNYWDRVFTETFLLVLYAHHQTIVVFLFVLVGSTAWEYDIDSCTKGFDSVVQRGDIQTTYWYNWLVERTSMDLLSSPCELFEDKHLSTVCKLLRNSLNISNSFSLPFLCYATLLWLCKILFLFSKVVIFSHHSLV